MTKVAAIYARVSSDRQKENHTIASQVAALMDYAEAHEYKVPAEWRFQDEGYSGATLLRPGLEALRDLAAAGHLEAVLIYSPDRLSRKYAYQVLLAEELSRCGVELVFLKAPSGATPEDQLLLQFQGMIAEYERAQIAERSRRGKRHRAHQGSINVLSGAPYGYRYVRKSDTAAAYYEVLEAEAAVVRRVYEAYTQEGLSINAIAHRLNEEQIPTRTGTTRWERSTVWGMLRNPAYRGRACYGKTELRPRQRITRPLRKRQGLASRDSANHERPRPDWIEIAVPALVSEATFALAQEQLEQNKRHSPRRTIEPSLLQGMLVCERCGYALYRTSTQTSARKLYYYRCLGSDAYRHLRGAVCDNPPVRQDHLDAVVWKELVRLLEDPQVIQEELNRRLGSGPEGRSAEAARRVVTAGTGPAGEEHGPPAERLSGRSGEPGATSRSHAGTAQATASAASRTAVAGSNQRRPSALPAAGGNAHRFLCAVAVEGGYPGRERAAENPAPVGQRDFGGEGYSDHPPFDSHTRMPGPIRSLCPGRLTHLRSRQCPNPAHIIFCVQAVTTAPCGVPSSGAHPSAVSITFWVRNASSSSSTRPSATFSCTRSSSAACGIVSK